MEMLKRIDRFGVQGCIGRTLYEREIRRMIAANNVVTAFQMRKAAANWQAFQTEHPELGDLLFKAERLYNG
jgi:hypothetical protein